MLLALAALIWMLMRLRRERNAAAAAASDVDGASTKEAWPQKSVGLKDDSAYAPSHYAPTAVTYAGPTPPPRESEGLPRLYVRQPSL